MKKQPDNLFDRMVKNLMLPTVEGGAGASEKTATNLANAAIKKIKPKK